MKHRRVRPPRRRAAARVGEVALVAAVVLLAGFLVRTFVVAPFSIPSMSMTETLQVGDRILVDRASTRFRDVRRGEVVVFDGTDTFGAVDGSRAGGETDYVKRVIGVGGDRVVCCDDQGRLTVNGEPVHEESYLYPGDKPSELRFDVRVPAGRLWVMGDHRSNSRDSRAFLGAPGGGTIPTDDVIGPVLAVVWPLSRLGSVP